MWFESVYLQDAVRLRCDNMPRMKSRLKSHCESKAPFNYDTSRNAYMAGLQGLTSYSQAIAKAESLRLKIARESNLEVIKLTFPFASGRGATVHPAPVEWFSIGAGVQLPMRMLCIAIAQGKGSLIWPQFRKHDALSLSGLGVVASAIHMSYAEHPDYEGFRLEMIDVSAPEKGKPRQCAVYDFHDLPIMTQDELAKFFDPVFTAIKELHNEGYRPAVKGPARKEIDGDEPPLPGIFPD
tara:strand:- start:467 stop:1183 length:717 start_codon:yes stop_codon:yes gene_type:complete